MIYRHEKGEDPLDTRPGRSLLGESDDSKHLHPHGIGTAIS